MKPLVKDWISGFLDRHRARFNPPDWPDPETGEWVEYVKGWITAFATKQISEAEADEASRLLVLTPPRWRQDHIPALVSAVLTVRGQKSATDRARSEPAYNPDPGFDERALARWQSMTDGERERWLRLVDERTPSFARTPYSRTLLAMAWAEDPGSVIAAAPPRRAADTRGPRQAMGGPVADAAPRSVLVPTPAPRSVLVPTPAPEPEATTVAVAAPDTDIDPDEEF
jgi:hypothetical protein